MTDPWADVRQTIDIPIANADALQLELERLLADSDALLAVKLAAALTVERFGAEGAELRIALAALPEHLK